MEKTFKILALVFVLSLTVYWSNALADDFYVAGSIGKGGPMCGYSPPTGWDAIEAGRLIGLQVRSSAGGNLGEITDLLIDKNDGHIALVIIADSPYMGAKLVAAPFSALERLGDNILQLSFGDRDVPVTDMYTDRYAYDLLMSEDIVGLSRVPQTIDTHWAETLYGYYGSTPYWGKGEAPQIVSYRAIENHFSFMGFFRKETAPVLMGSMVRSSDGKTTGRIEDAVVDFKDGMIVLLVLDEVPGKGDALVGVPFAELSNKGDGFTLGVAGDKLAAAHTFNEDTDLHNVNWMTDDYKYFGVQPCWSEAGTQSSVEDISGNL